MTTQQSVSLSAFAFVSIVLIALLALCGYFTLQHVQSLALQRSQIAELNQRLETIGRSVDEIGSSTTQANRELKEQLSVIRVALQQSTNIQIDKTGAIITRKGIKSKGIELR